MFGKNYLRNGQLLASEKGELVPLYSTGFLHEVQILYEVIDQAEGYIVLERALPLIENTLKQFFTH